MLLGLVVLLVAASGCDEDDSAGEGSDRETQQLRTQVRIERAARIEAERQLARERTAWEHERRLAQATLREEGRKCTFGGVVAVVLGCLAAAAVVLVARERRVRRVLLTGVRHLLRREERDGP